eukprot:2878575-Amphidinium_carterae.1
MSAVAVYSVITRHLHQRVADAGGEVRVLSYIDGFSVGTKDPRSLGIARHATQEIIDDFGMTINSGKTKVMSHVEDVKSACEEAGYHMPYTQVAEHKVLGTIMGVGSECNSAKKFWLEKPVAVCTRVVRIAHLQVAFRSEAKLVEVNALALWRYIPLSRHLSLHEFSEITRTIMNTLGNGTTRSPAMAVEMMFATQLRIHSAHPCYSHLYEICKAYAQYAAMHTTLCSIRGIVSTSGLQVLPMGCVEVFCICATF